MHYSDDIQFMPRVAAPVVITNPPPHVVRGYIGTPQGVNGLGALELTDALGLGTLAFVVGGAIGFAIGAGIVAAAVR